MVSTSIKTDTSYSNGGVTITICSCDGKIDGRMMVKFERDFDDKVIWLYRDDLTQLKEVLDEMFNRGII